MGFLRSGVIRACLNADDFIFINDERGKSSAVRVDERGGGQKNEENVLKSMQDLKELLILL